MYIFKSCPYQAITCLEIKNPENKTQGNHCIIDHERDIYRERQCCQSRGKELQQQTEE